MKNILIIFIQLALITICFGLAVQKCSEPIVPTIESFTYTINGTNDNTTKAHLCYDNDFLYIYWWNIDEEVISTYEKCNDPLYNEDAVEIFIATKDSFPRNYYELEVSPKGQLFFADITNPTGYCSNLGTIYYPCTSATYHGKITDKGWEATLKLSNFFNNIGLDIIGRGVKQNYFMGNLFRIDKSHTKPTRYLSYQPTMNSPPCFHQP